MNAIYAFRGTFLACSFGLGNTPALFSALGGGGGGESVGGGGKLVRRIRGLGAELVSAYKTGSRDEPGILARVSITVIPLNF